MFPILSVGDLVGMEMTDVSQGSQRDSAARTHHQPRDATVAQRHSQPAFRRELQGSGGQYLEISNKIPLQAVCNLFCIAVLFDSFSTSSGVDLGNFEPQLAQ